MTHLLPYNKSPKSHSDQCIDLSGKGLIFKDVNSSIKFMDQVGYYRLKAYMLPFRNQALPGKPFKAGTTFEDVKSLYLFDEELRNLLFSYIQRVEVGIRASFTEHMCKVSGNAFWHIDSSIFGHGNVDYAVTVSKIRNMFLGSKEDFAIHYKNKYYNSFCKFYTDIPPSWVFSELMSFGNMSSTIKYVEVDYIKAHDLDRMASKKLGVNKFKKLCNWVSVIHEVRNHTAHHARVFNRNLKAPDGIKQILDSKIPLVKHGAGNEDQLNRIYTALAAIQVILKKLGYPPIGPDLKKLFNKYPIHRSFMDSMGFPQGWYNEAIFK